MPKISVILPVYNVEKYISQCLDSILGQTFTDFECICVNDGSTDNSLSILQRYADKDNRIKVINQKNKGRSYARNTALKLVTGQYVVFVDSDDFVLENYLNGLITVAEKENSDIVYCRHKIYYFLDNKYVDGPNKEILNKLFFKYSKSTQKDKQLEYVLDIVENSRSVCMKLYKNSVIKNNDISFFEDIYAEEDFSFNILANLYSQKKSFLDEELYCYRKKEKSIASKDDTFRINAIKSFTFLTKEIEKRGLLENNKVLRNFVLSKFIFNIGKKIPKSKQKDIYSHILEHFLYLKNILKSSSVEVTKINFYILIMKIFKTKSFMFFRILKNF